MTTKPCISRRTILEAIGPLGASPMDETKIHRVLDIPHVGMDYEKGRVPRMFVDAHLAELMDDGIVELVQSAAGNGYRLRMPEVGWSWARAHLTDPREEKP